MTLSPIDWIIIAVYLVGCVIAGVWMKRYVRGVEDFAVAGRELDVNLGIASLAATEVGIVTIMYTAEEGFTKGFAGATPGVVTALAMFLVGLTGFVIKPLRNSGVMTIPELFQTRFGTRVRWLAGLVVILGGVLNMGIFLRLGGEFLVNMTGLPPHYLEWTMTGLLAVVLIYTVLGGMLSVLITDYLQFLVMGLGIVVTSVLVVWNLNWTDLNKALVRAQKSGIVFQEGQKPREAREKEEQASIRNTQGQQAADDLAKQQREQYGQWLKANSANLSQQDVLVSTKKNEPVKAMTMADPYDPFASNGVAWVVWQTILGLAVVTTWQTTIARVLAARDSRSARLIYRRTAFYWVGRFGLPGLWGAAAFVFFTAHGGLPEEGLHSLTAMPRFLKEIMPMGVIGIMIAAMLAAEMSTDSGYLLTWATVIYNDLVCPVLRQPLSPAGRLVVIRAMVLAIGVFLIFYGLWYELPGGAWDYLAVTGNIYLASLFTLLVGGLYWRKANSWGATAAIVLGAIGPLSFLVTNALVPRDPPLVPAAVAGLASFAMSFAGMIFGSLAANYLGKGFCGTVKVASEGGS